jgi:glycosyltransferase involved in cell wall biosynthesis
MRVLFLEQQPCMRALKYAVGLRSRRPDLRLGFAFQGRTLSHWYGTGDELFERWWRLDSPACAEIRRVVGEFRPDLIHSHNLPDSLTVAAHEAVDGGIPVVHDVHDLQSLRQTPYEAGFPEPPEPLVLEKRAVEGSAAVVTVSPELAAAIRERYRLPSRTLVFPNYALQRDLPQILPPPGRGLRGRPRLVYQGTVSENGGHYDLRAIFEAIVAGGAALDVYPGRSVAAYKVLDGVRCRPTLVPKELLRTLPRYDFGWAGFNAELNRAHVDTALPNKVFEYLGCGLPVLTLGHRALARFLDEYGVGASLPTLADLGAQLAALDVEALRRQVAAVRLEFTVEANIDCLLELYESVV